MNSQHMNPVLRPFRGTVRVPGSKSITNRALVLAALADGSSTLAGVLLADDTRRMLEALQTLGFTLQIDEPARTVTITGQGGKVPAGGRQVFCGNSGTTIRFLTALLAAARGTAGITLDGVERMRQRPIGQLVEQLRALGGQIQYGTGSAGTAVGGGGYPPLTVEPSGLRGGRCRFQEAASSQYISAVLMAAPYAQGEPVTVELIGPVTSEPYVEMTIRMMQQWGYDGLKETTGGGRTLHLAVGQYQPRTYAIEPDASNASYFLAAAALVAGSSLTVEGLGKGSLQGDIAVADVLHQMGAGLAFGRDFVTVTGTGELHGIEIDMNHIPDMVQTVAVVALFADSPTHITNVGNLRIKETDRLAALENELSKFGARVTTTADSISIEPGPVKSASIRVATYDDHRMALAFALAGLRVPGVEILEPGCTAKTYPEYFVDLQRAVGME